MPGHAPGFYFALHLLRVQGFYFALLQYSPIQAFTVRFVPYMQLYRPRRKTAHKALQPLFLRLCPLNRPRYQTETSGYNTACATLERITAAQRLQYIPDANAAPGRCTGQRSRSIIIMYIRVQHIADHASPAACDLAPGQSGTFYQAGQSINGRGGRRRTIGGSRRISFSGFRPIANRGQQ